ncbi:hypothetical protein GUJ93_ZPchr0007g4178 [Zizania palustris]|uniref:Uncharacterized protein n=1 Tax=Zizania palustris TaxID=103762 RepID=A0A8J5VRA3_ZIZPA|nr:hypothetical protein GUJ93_ZPchr0007g4178 [Zizania palustris]
MEQHDRVTALLLLERPHTAARYRALGKASPKERIVQRTSGNHRSTSLGRNAGKPPLAPTSSARAHRWMKTNSVKREDIGERVRAHQLEGDLHVVFVSRRRASCRPPAASPPPSASPASRRLRPPPRPPAVSAAPARLPGLPPPPSHPRLPAASTASARLVDMPLNMQECVEK